MKLRNRIVHICVILGIALLAGTIFAQDVDKETGLVIDKGLETVKRNCTPCHSAKLVIQNRMDRDDWLKTIRWMQETQNLWQFPPDTEKQILDYLAKHYAPHKQYRRTPLNVPWEDEGKGKK